MPTVNASAKATINAPASAIWALLGEGFPNISQWTDQVKKSASTSAKPNGVGASRHCDLAPAGSLDETIVEWVPEERLVIDVKNIKLMPIKRSTTTFTLRKIDDETTEVTMAPAAEAKGGPLAPIVARRLEKGLPKAAAGLLEDLRIASEL